MISLSIILLALLLLEAALPAVHAKCCRDDSGGDCGDNSAGTPCCGYKKCNGFCCACPGVQLIREVVDSGHLEWTSVITAPIGTTWTCRASHITTWYPPPTDAVSIQKREQNEDLATGSTTAMPQPTFTNPPTRMPPTPYYSPDMLAELQSTFNHVCGGHQHNGVGVITLDQYLGFFNVSDEDRGRIFGKNVEAKFRAHDINGDGMLTLDEAKLLCDGDGCD